MKRVINKKYIVFMAAAVLLISSQCKQPYIAPAGASAVTNILHVEGDINTSGDTCVITLSRTVKLTESVNSAPELNATVTVESLKGDLFPLTETSGGKYIFPNFGFLPAVAKEFRLNIATSDGKIYRSDFVPIKNAQPIDSLYYKADANGLTIYSDTHDPSNNSRYYRWDYDETWIVISAFDSHFKAQFTPVQAVVARDVEDQIDSCWINGKSSTLIINSSAKLSQDVITNNPVAFVSSASEKLFGAYSILLHQHALTKEAFEYWQNLKKNTEQLGSIFDAQPSQIQGNIHCQTDPSEPVLGFISAGADSRKRIIIRRISLPAFPVSPRNKDCRLDTLKIADVPALFGSTAIPVDGVYDARNKLTGYTISVQRECVDCTVRGTNKKPAYWK